MKQITVFDEIVVAVPDECVPLQEVLIGLPLEEYVIALFRRADRIEHVGVCLTVKALLECLDMKA